MATPPVLCCDTEFNHASPTAASTPNHLPAHIDLDHHRSSATARSALAFDHRTRRRLGCLNESRTHGRYVVVARRVPGAPLAVRGLRLRLYPFTGGAIRRFVSVSVNLSRSYVCPSYRRCTLRASAGREPPPPVFVPVEPSCQSDFAESILCSARSSQDTSPRSK